MVLGSTFWMAPMRWAARPVGAQMLTIFPCAHHNFTIDCSTVVFPHPGPPVMTRMGASDAISMAARCPAERTTSVVSWFMSTHCLIFCIRALFASFISLAFSSTQRTMAVSALWN